MRWPLTLAVLVAASPLSAADLSSVGPVYFWPMTAALDQYVAERATTEGVFEVTVDPASAKSVMTDRIDSGFLEGLEEIFPLVEEAELKTEDADESDDEDDQSSVESGLQSPRPPNRAKGRPQGTVFLVDVKTRKVLWSTFLGDYDRRPERLHKEAGIVVERLRKSMGVALP